MTTRLLCVPHAGAGASSFARWLELFGESVVPLRIQLPGHENLAKREPLRRVGDVVGWLLPRLPAGGPVALYGHSMGALVVYELARALTAAGTPPVHVFVSGRRAPHLPARRAPVHDLPDDEFLAAVEGMGRLAEASPALRTYAIRVTRADLELSEVYEHLPVPRLHCPLTVFHGTADRYVTLDEATAWKELTDNDFAIHTFPGDHFFHQRHRAALAATMTEALE
ncbi:thioesterase [Amycolatopsis sp. K13G38]|uniref:Thioesterase n=1 Tax=Amycolatopsis acididurans TaxID=2724524 RepID=A0ABX1IUW1_9PSEU|nr:alpha/beta fold hydrolase [Amycolatopsis acididurans]NKQ51288.1 thioesterase [Amycolatopsis acididurans]